MAEKRQRGSVQRQTPCLIEALSMLCQELVQQYTGLWPGVLLEYNRLQTIHFIVMIVRDGGSRVR
jgi:hypothetical protein